MQPEFVVAEQRVSGVELSQDYLSGPAVQLGVQRPITVELEVGVLVPGVVVLDELPDFSEEIDRPRLGRNAPVQLFRQLLEDVLPAHSPKIPSHKVKRDGETGDRREVSPILKISNHYQQN